MTTTTSVQLDIAPLSGTIGAEIRNIDLHQPLDSRDAGRRPPGSPRLQGHLLPGPAPLAGRAQGLRRRVRPDHGRTPRHPGDRGAQRGLRDRLHEGPAVLLRRRARGRRPGALAHRRHLRRDSSAGLGPQRHRDPPGRRRHPLGRHAGCLRGTVGSHPRPGRRSDGHPRRHPRLRLAPQGGRPG